MTKTHQMLISTDSHVTEPIELYAERMDVSYRDRAPRIANSDGWRTLFVEGLKPRKLMTERELGHIVANADASIGDVERVAMFVRVLPIAAVIGVNVEMLGGMADSGLDPAGVLSGVPVIVALGAACDQLVEAGVDALRLELLGPVLAMECRSRRLHIDGVRWSIEEMGGTLRVSNLAPRALSVRSFDTGRHGRVTAEICPCARFDPVIELAAEGGGTPA